MLTLRSFMLALGRLGGGGGAAPDTTAPVWSLESYDSGTDIYTATITEAGPAPITYYGVWSASDPLSNAALEAAATTIQEIAAGENYFDVDDTGLAPGTWYLQQGVKDAAGNWGRATVESQVIAAPSFTETWADYANGEGWTELDVAYARSNANLTTSVVTDADGTSGLGMNLGSSGAGPTYYMSRDDIATALAARTVSQRVNILVQFKLLASVTSTRAGIGFISGGLHWGFRITRFGVNNNILYSQLGGDLDISSNTVNLSGTVNDSLHYWARIEINGADLKTKFWLDGASEPGSWANTQTAGGNITFSRLDLAGSRGSPACKFLGYSVAIDADAPAF